jgi:putative peptidoglycan lipid II flippase
VKLFASAFYALRDTRTPVAVAIVSLSLSAGLAFAFMRPLGVAGIALASSIGAMVNVTANLALLERRIGRVLGGIDARLLASTFVGAAFATAAGAAVAAGAAAVATHPVALALLVAVIFGTAYFAVMLLLRHPDAVRLWQLLRVSSAN